MDDTRTVKVTIAGKAYLFAHLTQSQREVLTLLDTSTEEDAKEALHVMRKLLRRAAGAEQWSELRDRMVDNEVTISDILGSVEELVKEATERIGNDAQ